MVCVEDEFEMCLICVGDCVWRCCGCVCVDVLRVLRVLHMMLRWFWGVVVYDVGML